MPAVPQKRGLRSDTDTILPITMPRLPPAVLTRFGDEAQAWQDNLDRWWQVVRACLVRKLDVTSDATSLSDRVTELEEKVADHLSTPTP